MIRERNRRVNAVNSLSRSRLYPQVADRASSEFCIVVVLFDEKDITTKRTCKLFENEMNASYITNNLKYYDRVRQEHLVCISFIVK